MSSDSEAELDADIGTDSEPVGLADEEKDEEAQMMAEDEAEASPEPEAEEEPSLDELQPTPRENKDVRPRPTANVTRIDAHIRAPTSTGTKPTSQRSKASTATSSASAANPSKTATTATKAAPKSKLKPRPSIATATLSPTSTTTTATTQPRHARTKSSTAKSTASDASKKKPTINTNATESARSRHARDTLAAESDEAAQAAAAASIVISEPSSPIDSAPPDSRSSSSPAAASSLANFDFSTYSTVSSLQDLCRDLSSQVAARDQEVSELSEALLLLQSELDSMERSHSNVGNEVAKDLAKKNRELSLQLNRERHAHAKEMDALKKAHAAELEAVQQGSPSSSLTSTSKTSSPSRKTAFGSTTQPASSTPPASDPISLEHRLKESQTQVGQFRQSYIDKCHELSMVQSRVKSLQRALVKEIDEKIKPEEIDERFLGRFKGRAQKISLLQSKVRDLERNLAQVQRGVASTTSVGDDTDRLSTSSSSLTTPTSNSGLVTGVGSTLSHAVHDYHEAPLRKMAADKAADHFQIKQQNEQLKNEMSALRNKYDAAKARAKNLENELFKVRANAKLLFDKSAADDKLIDELRAAVDRVRREADKEKKVGAAIMKNGESSSSTSTSHRSSSSSVSHLESQLAKQSREIAQLRSDLSKAQALVHSQQLLAQVLPTKLLQLQRSEMETSLELERVEKEKLKNMIDVANERIQQLETTLMETNKKLIAAQTGSGVGEKKIKGSTSTGVRGATRTTSLASRAGATSSSSASSSESISTLHSQLSSALSEQKLIQTSYSATLAKKDEDIQIMNDILNEKNALYLKNMAEMKRKFEELVQSLQQTR